MTFTPDGMQPDMSVGGYGGPGSYDRDTEEREQFQQLQAAVQALADNLSGYDVNLEADAPQVRIRTVCQCT